MSNKGRRADILQIQNQVDRAKVEQIKNENPPSPLRRFAPLAIAIVGVLATVLAWHFFL